MDDRTYALARGLGLHLPVEEADKLLSCADGNCALLYLYILRVGGQFSEEEAARALKRTRQEIGRAAEGLRALGILTGGGPGLRAPADELPEYEAADIQARCALEPAFKAVVTDTQRLLGKVLSTPDLVKLFGIYDYLGLPGEVILLLVNHCVEDFRQRHGPGRLPSMRSIEKEAYEWARREILTMERAEEHLAVQARRRESMSLVREALQIRGRDFSATERRYVESWLEMGFTPEALEIAYDRTVVKTGQLQWRYMDTIVRSWHEKNLHSPREIEEKDRPQSRQPRPGAKGNPPEQKDDLALLERLLNGNR